VEAFEPAEQTFDLVALFVSGVIFDSDGRAARTLSRPAGGDPWPNGGRALHQRTGSSLRRRSSRSHMPNQAIIEVESGTKIG